MVVSMIISFLQTASKLVAALMILTQSNCSPWMKTRQSTAIVHGVCQQSAGQLSGKPQPAQQGTMFLAAIWFLVRMQWQTRRAPRVNTGKKTSFSSATHRRTCFSSPCKENTGVPPNFVNMWNTLTIRVHEFRSVYSGMLKSENCLRNPSTKTYE